MDERNIIQYCISRNNRVGYMTLILQCNYQTLALLVHVLITSVMPSQLIYCNSVSYMTSAFFCYNYISYTTLAFYVIIMSVT